jgi:hypothetical protein
MLVTTKLEVQRLIIIFLVAMIGSSQSLDFSNIEQPFTDVDFSEIVNKCVGGKGEGSEPWYH